MQENILIEKNISDTLSTAFLNYAGYNLQRRAIPDARDGLKWGARQLLHSQALGKFTFDKPFKKAIKSVSQAMGFSYVHGDASAYGTFIRMAKPFAMRYPLQEANGNYGTLINPDDHSASRYVELRGSEISSYLLKDLEKDTILENDWEDTYDLEGKFPKVLPAKGFYNLINGCISIGSGMSCSIPPFNLVEVNNALIKLLFNPDCDFEEILCFPDFPTGATILNENEVKESLRNGCGKAVKIRSKVDYDSNERCLIVKEMPYSTYTNTICKEIANLMIEKPELGIQDVIDYTGQKPDLRIYLSKKANVDKVIKELYKNTSLQTFYSINMTVLDNGIVPCVMGWKELLQSYLNHQLKVYRRSFEFDLKKIENRLHIIKGLMIALANLDEVIKTIKESSSTKEANKNLCSNFLLDEVQAKAILDMKLARLAKLEVKKLEDEKNQLEKDKEKICNILENDILLKKEIEKGLKEVAEKFGDARRTQILNIEGEEDEPTEIKSLLISLTNQNNIFVSENSSLFVQRRGGVGAKFKLNKGEYVVSTSTAETTDSVLFFTDKGNFYHYVAGALPIDEKIPVESLFEIKSWEKVTAMSSYNKNNSKEYIIFFTKNGIIKKSKLEDYNMKRNGGLKAIELNKEDEVVNVIFTNEEDVAMLTKDGYFVIISTKDINAIGRTARGVKGINLSDGDKLICASIYNKNTKYVASISSDGYIKRTDSSELTKTGRGTKGKKIQKVVDDAMLGFINLIDEKDVIITSSGARIKINVDSIPLLSRGAQGNKSIKLKENEKVIGISKF